MQKNSTTFRQSIAKNAVALISLIVAIIALTVNIWRAERSETNRSLRIAAFELLQELGELQLVVDLRHYDNDPIGGNPIRGWSHVMMVQDLSMIMPKPVAKSGEKLHQIWQKNWQYLGQDEAKTEEVTQQIDKVRANIRQLISGLE